jgi:hypothetical protein
MGKDSLIAWCSWCFEETKHDKIQQNYIRRNVYQCTNCLNRTLECRRCKAMARGHNDWDDEQCALCDGTIKSWGKKPTSTRGYCSWCFEKTDHKLVQKNTTRRDVFECLSCGRRTLPCRSDGCGDFARGHSAWDDEKCIKCDGTITEWGNAEKNRLKTSKKGWCSWCFERTTHSLEQVNSVRRDVYICDDCLQTTLLCTKCKEAMTRGGPGWDDNRCSKCRNEITDWNKQKAKRDRIFSRELSTENIIQELERSTDFRNRAYESGMIRPFLLLVSMEPAMRNQLAASLGWSLVNQKYFGNAHEEAWDIINTSAKGIQARTNESWETLNPFSNNCNWYEVLYHVNKAVFNIDNIKDLKYSESINDCKNSKRNLCSFVEDEFIQNVSLLQQKHMTQDQLVKLEELMESDEVLEISKTMEKTGIKNKQVIRYTINMMYQGIRSGGFNSYIYSVKIAAWMNNNLGTNMLMATAPKFLKVGVQIVNVAQWMWLATDVLGVIFASGHGRLFLGTNIICTQRLLLTTKGIRIDDYY